MLNPKATKEPVEQNEDDFWEDGFPVNTDRARLERVVAACNVHIKNSKFREPETREDFGSTPTDGVGLKVRRKRMGATWDCTKHITAEFGRFGSECDGHWFVLIQDLFGDVYGFAEYTSMTELHKVWELD